MISRYAIYWTVLVLLLSSSFTLPLRAQDLNLYVTVDSDVKAPGDRLFYTLTASNPLSADLSDVTIEVHLPNHIASFYGTLDVLGGELGCGQQAICQPGEIASWTIGTLAPHESRSVFLVTSISESAPQGEVLQLTASESTQQVSASQDVTVDITPLLALSLAPDVGPAVAGEPFTYTLTVGNVGSGTPTDIVLRMELPEQTSFVSASGDGVEQDGMVTWNIGTLGSGDGDQVRLTVTPDAALSAGEAIEAMAELDSGIATEQLVRATTVTPIGTQGPLHVAYGVSETALAPDDLVTYTLTATNTGPVDLAEVAVELLLPPSIVSFYGTLDVLGGDLGCGQQAICQPGEIASWTIGTLAPGESQAVAFRTSIAGEAPPGRVLASRLAARSASTQQTTAAQDLAVDPTPLLTLGVTPDVGPAVAGEPFTYTLTVGNVGSRTATDGMLHLTIPEGTNFTDATCGWTMNDDVISWDLGVLGVGAGNRFRVTVTPDAMTPDGSLFESRAELDPHIDTEQIVRASTVAAVGEQGPLSVTYDVSPTSIGQGEELSFTLTATNTGPVDLAEVAVELLLPPSIVSFYGTLDVLGGDLGCGQQAICQPGEIASWTVGTLAPQGSQSISFSTEVVEEAVNGRTLQSRIAASAGGVNQITMAREVFVGALTNAPPAQAMITSPPDGTSFVVGGGESEDPVSPDSAFVVEWETPCDPESDPLTYTWQLSDAQGFSNLLIDAPSAEEGMAPRFETDFGTLAALLAANVVEIGGSLKLYHRVVASDGTNEVASAPFSIEFTRGTITSNENAPGLPKVFALHGNYPNPFNPTTTFSFDLPEPAEATLAVYDMLGRKVATVVSEHLPAGTFWYGWDAASLPNGVYIYRLQAGTFSQAKKLILLK